MALTTTKPLTLTYVIDTRRYLVLAIAAGLLAVGLLGFATVARLQAVVSLISQQRQETEKLTGLRLKLQQLQAVADPAVQSQSALVNLLLPERKPLVELLNTLNVVSTKSQIRLQSFELTPGGLSTESAQRVGVPSVSGTEVLKLEFTAEGTLGQLNQFMNAIEQTTPLITITQLTLTSGSNQKAQSRTIEEIYAQPYIADLEVEAAYFTKSVAATLESELPKITAAQQKIIDDLARFTQTITPAQTEIVGGGLQDPFGVAVPEFEQK